MNSSVLWTRKLRHRNVHELIPGHLSQTFSHSPPWVPGTLQSPYRVHTVALDLCKHYEKGIITPPYKTRYRASKTHCKLLLATQQSYRVIEIQLWLWLTAELELSTVTKPNDLFPVSQWPRSHVDTSLPLLCLLSP